MGVDASAPSTARASITFWAIGALFVAGLAVFHIAAQALLLTFAGVLFGTALRGLAVVASERLGWRLLPTLAACIGVLLGLMAAAALWIIPHAADQAQTLADRLRQAYESVRQSATQSDLLGNLLGKVFEGPSNLAQRLGQFAARAAGILASALGVLGALVFVFFLTLYVAIGAGVYRRGFLHLVSPKRRQRAGEVLDELASTLRRWLLGRLVSMTAVGVSTSLGLWLLGVPLPLTLGLISGVLGFVPNFGPIASVLPAALLAFTLGPWHVVYVVALYLGVNLADGYLLTPLLQKKAVALPPGLIITSQVVLAALWGVLGVTFATPLSACLLVLTRELYVKDALGDQSLNG